MIMIHDNGRLNSVWQLLTGVHSVYTILILVGVSMFTNKCMVIVRVVRMFDYSNSKAYLNVLAGTKIVVVLIIGISCTFPCDFLINVAFII